MGRLLALIPPPPPTLLLPHCMFGGDNMRPWQLTAAVPMHTPHHRRVAALIVVFVAYDLTERGTTYDWANLIIAATTFAAVALMSHRYAIPALELRLPPLSTGQFGDQRGSDELEEKLQPAESPSAIETDADAVMSPGGCDDTLPIASSNPARMEQGEKDELREGKLYHPELERRFRPMSVLTAS